VDDSTVNAALLLIRLGLGLMLIAHGVNKIFGSGRISGTARWFEALGLTPGILHAWVAASTEIGAGLLMCFGFLFPAPSAAFIGLMTVAGLTDHRGKGFFVFKGGWEYVAFVAIVAAAVGFTGAGRWSVDQLVGFHHSGLSWGMTAVLVGLATGAATGLGFARPAAKEAEA
jgi:putative oxidoreductase